MKRLSLLLILTMLLSACSTAGTPTAAPTPMSTAIPATATATEIAPSMENLPVEWQGKIDHVETMTNMDGTTTRVVAVEKLSQEDIAAGKTEARLRVLQWDGKEWVSYVPQVGWAGWGEVINPVNGEIVPSKQNRDIQLPDRESLAAPLKYADGTDVPMGLLGSVYFNKDDANAPYFTFLQGYLLKSEPIQNPDGTLSDMLYAGVPLESGDWQIILFSAFDQDNPIPNIFSLESVSPDDFGKDLKDVVMRPVSPSATYNQVYEYLAARGGELVGEPMIFGLMMNPEQNGGVYDGYNSYSNKLELLKALKEESNPVECPRITQSLSPSIMSADLWSKILGN